MRSFVKGMSGSRERYPHGWLRTVDLVVDILDISGDTIKCPLTKTFDYVVDAKAIGTRLYGMFSMLTAVSNSIVYPNFTLW